jgi:hypothetical protein
VQLPRAGAVSFDALMSASLSAWRQLTTLAWSRVFAGDLAPTSDLRLGAEAAM